MFTALDHPFQRPWLSFLLIVWVVLLFGGFLRGSSTEELVTVAVSHLKSKGSACDDVGDPDKGDGQGNCNSTRTAAAIALAEWPVAAAP